MPDTTGWPRAPNPGRRACRCGFATIEAADGFGIPLDLDTSFQQLIENYVAGLRARIGATAE